MWSVIKIEAHSKRTEPEYQEMSWLSYQGSSNTISKDWWDMWMKYIKIMKKFDPNRNTSVILMPL